MTTVWTIGHSNRPIGELVRMLADTGIQRLVDVRAKPVSRRYPQFNREALGRSLRDAGIAYEWQGDVLGGFRTPRPGSPHVALEGAFRGYADHMETSAFGRTLDELVAGPQRTALMCAERKPSDCHRSLIADALLARGITVEHLIAPGVSTPAALRPEARLVGGQLRYDRGGQPTLFL